jgi:hypothetical protein
MAVEDGSEFVSEQSDGVREEMVQKLLKGFRENEGSAALGDFLGAEFQPDPPTDAEHAEAHRRYVDELAERGGSELGDKGGSEREE